MNGQVGKLTVDRFESLLEAYGGNLARWPTQHALAAQSLLQSSSEARARLAGAQALDRLLDKASSPDPQRLRLLTDRIVAAAEGNAPLRKPGHSPAAAASADDGARVIPLPVPRKRMPAPAPVVRPAPARPRRQWQAAAALAASLMMGIVIGLTDVGQSTTLGVTSLAGASQSASDTELVLSALQIDGIDEDQI